jgi:hypothetical protein
VGKGEILRYLSDEDSKERLCEFKIQIWAKMCEEVPSAGEFEMLTCLHDLSLSSSSF